MEILADHNKAIYCLIKKKTMLQQSINLFENSIKLLHYMLVFLMDSIKYKQIYLNTNVLGRDGINLVSVVFLLNLNDVYVSYVVLCNNLCHLDAYLVECKADSPHVNIHNSSTIITYSQGSLVQTRYKILIKQTLHSDMPFYRIIFFLSNFLL